MFTSHLATFVPFEPFVPFVPTILATRTNIDAPLASVNLSGQMVNTASVPIWMPATASPAELHPVSTGHRL